MLDATVQARANNPAMIISEAARPIQTLQATT
jgi:hypothetical protein